MKVNKEALIPCIIFVKTAWGSLRYDEIIQASLTDQAGNTQIQKYSFASRESIIEIKTNEIETRCQHFAAHARLINEWQASKHIHLERHTCSVRAPAGSETAPNTQGLSQWLRAVSNPNEHPVCLSHISALLSEILQCWLLSAFGSIFSAIINE